jgi:hypothetical protein
MDQIVEELRQKINEVEEEEAVVTDFIKSQKSREMTTLEIGVSPLEALGFRSNLKYGPKAKLRKLCSRFLRISYLFDFITTASLADLLISSIGDMIDRLELLQ